MKLREQVDAVAATVDGGGDPNSVFFLEIHTSTQSCHTNKQKKKKKRTLLLHGAEQAFLKNFLCFRTFFPFKGCTSECQIALVRLLQLTS